MSNTINLTEYIGSKRSISSVFGSYIPTRWWDYVDGYIQWIKVEESWYENSGYQDETYRQYSWKMVGDNSIYTTYADYEKRLISKWHLTFNISNIIFMKDGNEMKSSFLTQDNDSFVCNRTCNTYYIDSNENRQFLEDNESTLDFLDDFQHESDCKTFTFGGLKPVTYLEKVIWYMDPAEAVHFILSYCENHIVDSGK